MARPKGERGEVLNASRFFCNARRNRVLARSVFRCLPRRMSCVMAPCANWKGYLKLSLVSGPVALFPATTARDRVPFNVINRETGHRVRYDVVDAETGEEVPQEDRVK